jgi:hypothetical protein
MSRGEIPAGQDLLRTVARGTQFHFNELPIPSGFFASDSQAFTETVQFHGRQLSNHFFNGQTIEDVDTVVQRKESVELPPPYPCSRTVPIELAGLSLESSEPIGVQIGSQTELWDVQVELSESRRSVGVMTITKTQLEGGLFDSEFTVFPVFRFIRQSDGKEKILDVGALPLSSADIEKVTLRSHNSPWVHSAPEELAITRLNENFLPGVRAVEGPTGIVSIRDDEVTEEGPSCAHPVSSTPACPIEESKIVHPDPRVRTYVVPGSTLAAAKRWLRRNRRDRWGLTRWGPQLTVHRMCQGRVNNVTVRVPITIQLPRWSGFGQAGPNSQAEWQRMFDALSSHEQGHVDIAHQHFDGDLAESLLGKTRQGATNLFNAAVASAGVESRGYDEATDFGALDGVDLDTTITD